MHLIKLDGVALVKTDPHSTSFTTVSKKKEVEKIPHTGDKESLNQYGW